METSQDGQFPILYQVFSDILNATTYIVIVDRPGSWRSYDWRTGQEPWDSSDDYDERGRAVFDKPKVGVTRLPIGTQNKLRCRPILKSSATQEEIVAAFESMATVSIEAIEKAYSETENS